MLSSILTPWCTDERSEKGREKNAGIKSFLIINAILIMFIFIIMSTIIMAGVYCTGLVDSAPLCITLSLLATVIIFPREQSIEIYNTLYNS